MAAIVKDANVTVYAELTERSDSYSSEDIS